MARLQGEGVPAAAERKKGQGSTLEGTRLCQHLEAGPPASRTAREHISIVSNHPVCGTLSRQPWETNTPPGVPQLVHGRPELDTRWLGFPRPPRSYPARGSLPRGHRGVTQKDCWDPTWLWVGRHHLLGAEHTFSCVMGMGQPGHSAQARCPQLLMRHKSPQRRQSWVVGRVRPWDTLTTNHVPTPGPLHGLFPLPGAPGRLRYSHAGSTSATDERLSVSGTVSSWRGRPNPHCTAPHHTHFPPHHSPSGAFCSLLSSCLAFICLPLSLPAPHSTWCPAVVPTASAQSPAWRSCSMNIW